MILLIHPPLMKAGEPPAGIATLAACLRGHNIPCSLLDANIEGQLFLLNQAGLGSDRQASTKTWDGRVLRHRAETLEAVRSPQLYQQPDRYRRAVFDLNRLLQLAAASQPELQISLNNCQIQEGNLLDSRFLLQCAEQYQRSLFHFYFAQRLEPLLAQNSPRFVGISLNFLSQALASFALLGYLRANFPQLQLLLGGGLVSSWMSSPDWKNPFVGLVDLCIKGPGEGPLLELCGKEEAAQTVAHDLAPDYANLPWDAYFSPVRVLPYAASRGCYWNRCAFCPEAAERNTYLPIAAAQVSSHLQTACVNSKVGLIHLLDNALSPALLRHFAGSAPLPAPWYGFARFHEQLTEVGFCRRLHAAGCVLLKLGLESGSVEVLTAMNKGAGLSMMRRVLRALQQAGIASYVYLLFGTLGESEAEARLTLEYTVRHSSMIGFLNLAIFNMPKNSEESARYQGSEFSAGDLSLYRDFKHPQGWDRRLIRHFLDREFKRQPAISAILRRDPPFFGSNHACLFTPAFPWPQA